jgi:hypothetical protein
MIRITIGCYGPQKPRKAPPRDGWRLPTAPPENVEDEERTQPAASPSAGDLCVTGRAAASPPGAARPGLSDPNHLGSRPAAPGRTPRPGPAAIPSPQRGRRLGPPTQFGAQARSRRGPDGSLRGCPVVPLRQISASRQLRDVLRSSTTRATKHASRGTRRIAAPGCAGVRVSRSSLGCWSTPERLRRRRNLTPRFGTRRRAGRRAGATDRHG